MIKKIYFSLVFMIGVLLFGALSAHALYWGVFNDFDDNYSSYGTYKFIYGIPIKYYVEDITEEMEDEEDDEDVETKIVSTLNAKQKQAEFSKIIEESFNAWPKQTREMIQKDGRSQEFADIFDLPEFFVLKQVSDKDNADIIFYFTTKDAVHERCGAIAGGCITAGEEQPEVFLPNIYIEDPYDHSSQEERKKKLLSITTHELGHYFGLTDEYEETYKSSLTYNNSNRMANHDSIMAASHKTNLGCDDVDGFINLIDLTLAMKPGLNLDTDEDRLEFSDRAKEGWASFCNGKKNGRLKPFKSAYYKEAKTRNHSDYQRGSFVYKYNEEGNVKDAEYRFIHLFNLCNNMPEYDKENQDLSYEYYVEDEENGLNYYFVVFKDGNNSPEVIRTIVTDSNGTTIMNLEIRKESNDTWKGNNKNYKFSITNQENCTLEESTYLDSFHAAFDNNNNLEKYSYDNNNGIPFTDSLKEEISSGIEFVINSDLQCTFEYILGYRSKKAISFSMPNAHELERDQEVINKVMTDFNLSEKEVIQKAKDFCLKLLKEDACAHRETCKFFRMIKE